tara:strand:- start:471 stop:632 length:162 start_codon:yes stop_codon:yes gene_type:complete
MKVEMVDGIRVMKLSDKGQQRAEDRDAMTMLHIWRLLNGGHAMRDCSLGLRIL